MANHTFKINGFEFDNEIFNIDVDVSYEWEGDFSDPDSLTAEIDAVDIIAYKLFDDGSQELVCNPLLIRQLEDAVCEDCVIQELDTIEPDNIDTDTASDCDGTIDE